MINIYRYFEMRKYKQISIETMHKMLIEYPDAEMTRKVLDAHMAHLRPTNNPIVLLYRMLRYR